MPTALDHLLKFAGRTGMPGVYRAINALRPAMSISPDRAGYVTRFAGLDYQGLLNEHIDREIFYFGGYARAELDFLDQAARRCNVKSFYDIGANVGQHALWMSQRVAAVNAFEPSVAARRRLDANIARNGVANIRLWPFGLGDRDEDANLGGGFANNSGSRSLMWGLEDGGEAVRVAQGDAFVAAHGLPAPDLIKIDVEGYERRVLVGLAETLVRHRPIIMIELVHPGKGDFANEQAFRNHLYPDHQLYTLNGRNRAVLSPFDWDAEEAVCIPAERAASFADMVGGSVLGS